MYIILYIALIGCDKHYYITVILFLCKNSVVFNDKLKICLLLGFEVLSIPTLICKAEFCKVLRLNLHSDTCRVLQVLQCAVHLHFTTSLICYVYFYRSLIL
jgi:hypothetical protein